MSPLWKTRAQGKSCSPATRTNPGASSRVCSDMKTFHSIFNMQCMLSLANNQTAKKHRGLYSESPEAAKLSDLTYRLFVRCDCELEKLCLSMQAASIGEAFVRQRKTSREPNGKSKKRNTEFWNCKKGHITRPTNRAELIVRSGVDLYQARNDRWLADSGAFKPVQIAPQGVGIGNDKMIYAVGIGTIDVEVYNVSLQVDYVSPQRYSLRTRVLNWLYIQCWGCRRPWIQNRHGQRMVMINKRELVRYKVSDLYTLLIRRHSGKLSKSALSQ
ncbi:hypothetical protein T11_9628 [Trichinella zimbabwensis]|uniref:Uncharacterized protein n=1 Tax=Trichinella zimbabwensis TaxID=268475 RepID=A0A0V1HUX3_9BILA|nr:hypothetical protein T11_9628 [Trichinella zimbabwensis]